MKNEERVSATRARLIEAAIEALAEIGYHRTTFVEVSRRSNLSRGAIHHHFDSIPDLMRAVVVGIGDNLREKVVLGMQAMPAGHSVWDYGIDFAWTLVQGRAHLALGQIRAAIATDEALRESVRDDVIAVDDWIHAQALQVVSEGNPEFRGDPVLLRVVLTTLTGAATRDAALGSPADDPERHAFLNMLKRVTALAAQSTERAELEV